ncbi:MAG TPA: winged helix-turn-helix transcriptional regulator [Candidatus Methylomirabilis sp.]|nr:winged helix-turn-helix transcriptional regulator [Candidatus Methylomirabilis sp.]
MDPQAKRELELLTEIAKGQGVTQRALAKKFGMALGLTNLYIKRLTRKGYVRIVNVKRSRLKYLLTPRGISEKARLAYQFMEYSLSYYTSLRETFRQRLSPLSLSGGRRVLLVGSGEVAEIAALVLWELDLSLEHVVDDEKAGSTFLGHKVRTFSEIPELSYDWVVLAVLNGSEEMLDRLRGLKVPEDRIVLVRDTPAQASDTDGAG